MENNPEQKTTKRKTGRSPAYPFISVEKALQQARALNEQEGEYEAPLSSAFNAWGYGAKSSGGRQTLATMKYYGLVELLGEGDARKVKVSDIALRILLDQREDDTEKNNLIRKVALTPTVHKAIYEKYPNGLASDGSVLHFLMFDLGFKKDASNELLAEFKETAAFAGLYKPENMLGKEGGRTHSDGGEADPPQVKVGDKIQWTSQGIDQFANGGTVLGISDDCQWVFTDQGQSAVPVSEVSIIEPSYTPPSTPPAPPPHVAAAMAAAAMEKGGQNNIEVKAGSRKAVFPVEDGDVTLIFPESITRGGLQELGEYLEVFLKKEQKKKDAG